MPSYFCTLVIYIYLTLAHIFVIYKTWNKGYLISSNHILSDLYMYIYLSIYIHTQIAKFMGPTWPPGARYWSHEPSSQGIYIYIYVHIYMLYIYILWIFVRYIYIFLIYISHKNSQNIYIYIYNIYTYIYIYAYLNMHLHTGLTLLTDTLEFPHSIIHNTSGLNASPRTW